MKYSKLEIKAMAKQAQHAQAIGDPRYYELLSTLLILLPLSKEQIENKIAALALGA